MNKIQFKIYYDVTAGRGSYDDEYQEADVDISKIKPIDPELTQEKQANKNTESNVYRATFETILENKKQHLKPHDFTPYHQYRRHSYNRGPVKRANGRNYSQKTVNEFPNENSCHHANEYNSNHKNNATNNQNPGGSTALNWSPMRISGK